ncbi:MAG: response regulator transcription factor [Anaerolineae bacterium]
MMPETHVTIILVDDHSLVRRGLAALLQMNQKYRVVAGADNGEDALTLAGQYTADLVILDLHMPRLNGLETLRRLKHRYPRVKILILSMYDDEELVSQALRDGAAGYILKHSMEDELFQALEAIVEGKQYLSPRLTLKSEDHFRDDGVDSPLTSREKEVIQLVAEGHTTNEIADMMSISPNTAGRHMANIMKKLHVHNRVELTRLAIRRGIVIVQQLPQDFHPD